MFYFLMSTSKSSSNKWPSNSLKCLNERHSYKLLILFILYNNFINSSVLAVTSVFDVSCSTNNNCSNITGDVMCDTESGKCSCAEGNVRMKQHHHCLPYVGMGEYCLENEQCRKADHNVICSKWSQRCQCTAGYDLETLENNSSMKLCLKTPMPEVDPYFVHIFSGLDPVHIVLGCLTGGLALLACFAGIFQLVRKKWTRPGCNNDQDSQFSPDLGFSTTSAPSQSQPYSDSQFSVTSPCAGDFACLDGNSTAPPTPGSLGDKDYIVTPPPTYEEALQQSGLRNTGSTTTV
ncbi:uncharacterized protein [Parasteatoda tepidariorum]|uniref:uncharacterized protein n=1 Tax=Parasteatoda tepidariorum TaxID=114398 RepID=UPI001C728B83|nr:uncharacterized protein LOC107450293 [Parasteatoda tepidariorum]